MVNDKPDPYFALMYEVGIINQISTAFLEARLPSGLLVSHFGVVSHLIRVRDGAKTTMTHTLAGLERLGFVDMRPNPEDKRSKQVWLMPAGRHFCNDALSEMAPLFEELGARFSSKRVAAMLPDLAEFRSMIDKLRDEVT